MATLSRTALRWWLLLGLVLTPAARAFAAVPAQAMEVKAVFTCNFVQFVKWPSTAFTSPTSPFVIGVSGDPEMVRLMTKAASGLSAGEHLVQVVPVKTPEHIAQCHLLYVAPGGEAVLRSVPASRPILTVGETDAFLAAGGMIRLLNDRNRIKVQVRLASARACALEINSQLLRIAEIVGPLP